MILKYISKSGNKIYGPPYTPAELADFYSRNANGPVTIANQLCQARVPPCLRNRTLASFRTVSDQARFALTSERRHI